MRPALSIPLGRREKEAGTVRAQARAQSLARPDRDRELDSAPDSARRRELPASLGVGSGSAHAREFLAESKRARAGAGPCGRA